MAVAAARPSYLERFNMTPNSKAVDQLGTILGNLERITALGQFSTGIGKYSAQIHGSAAVQEKFSSVSNDFGATRDGISALRFIPALVDLLTGKIFWERSEDGSWRRVKADTNNNPILDANSNYIDAAEGEEHWAYARKDWMSIAGGVIILGARFLSPLTWLHGIKAIDLGKHAKRMSAAVVGVYATVVSINLVQSIRDVIGEVNAREMRKKFANLICAILDTLALPFEFGVGMGGNPVFALVGSILGAASAFGSVAQEYLYYS